MSIDDCLRKHVEANSLHGADKYLCPVCKKKVDALKTTSIETFPRVLIVDFVRYNLGKKNNDVISYPKTLDLLKYSSSEIDKNNASRVQCQTEEHQVFCKGISPVYDLYGVIVHEGASRNSGHYFSYVKGFESSETWY